MTAYFKVLWDERAAEEPKFDLISMMAHAEAIQNMTMEEFMGSLGLLIVGGNDTTRNMMSGGHLYLSQNPAEWDKLKANPSPSRRLCPKQFAFNHPSSTCAEPRRRMQFLPVNKSARATRSSCGMSAATGTTR